MKKLFVAFLGLVFLYCLYLCAYSVLHGEVSFFNDVARDFLLLIELDQKKIVFIGPRSSTAGLFYGSLLTYLNYPAWVLGHGNPVAVAWFWFLLIIIFAVTSFFLVKKLFGELAGALYTILVTLKLATHANAIFEPVALYFLMPAFLFTIIQYEKTKKWMYLALHIAVIAAFVQLSPGIGAQFLILSSIIALYLIVKNKNWKHLLSFLVLPIGIANLIIFDARHSFTMAKALTGVGGSRFLIAIPDWISNRIQNIFLMQLFEGNNSYFLIASLIFIVVIVCSIAQIRKNGRMKPLYITLLFYYFGYMTLSYFDKTVLLIHYVYLLVPFTCFWLVSFLDTKFKALFLLIISIVFLLNLGNVITYKNSLAGYSAHDPDSWKGLLATGEKLVALQGSKPFGYFVFAPDSYAYQPRYAMIYALKNSKAHEYQKLSTTYVVAQPPPANDKYMDYRWWVKVPVGIAKKPDVITTMPNGYQILKFSLNSEEQKVPFDNSIELGIHFR